MAGNPALWTVLHGFFLHRWVTNTSDLGEEISNLLGILLLAHGGPGSLEDIPAFLDKVRGGRPCPEHLVDEVREKYRYIGGASPLPGITVSAARKLEETCGLPAHVGMLDWQPFLEDTIPRMVADGISKALVICLVPHFSECSVGRYRQRTASLSVVAGCCVSGCAKRWTAAGSVSCLSMYSSVRRS